MTEKMKFKNTIIVAYLSYQNEKDFPFMVNTKTQVNFKWMQGSHYTLHWKNKYFLTQKVNYC